MNHPTTQKAKVPSRESAHLRFLSSCAFQASIAGRSISAAIHRAQVSAGHRVLKVGEKSIWKGMNQTIRRPLFEVQTLSFSIWSSASFAGVVRYAEVGLATPNIVRPPNKRLRIWLRGRLMKRIKESFSVKRFPVLPFEQSPIKIQSDGILIDPVGMEWAENCAIATQIVLHAFVGDVGRLLGMLHDVAAVLFAANFHAYAH